jgi:hypothetical protein
MHPNLVIIAQNHLGASPKNGISLEGIILFLEKILAKTPNPELLQSIPDEMDPNYILHALPSHHEERSDKWAWPLIATKKKVNQNEAIFNFLKHNSLILNECITKIKSMENEGDGRKKEVGGNK